MLKTNQFRELAQASKDSAFEKMIYLVSIVHNLDIEEVSEWESSLLLEKYAHAQRIARPQLRHINEITLDNTVLKLMPFNTIKLGQFIDLESYINEGKDANIHRIAASIFMAQSGGGMYEVECEEYSKINVEYRAQLIDELPINYIFGAVEKYLKFRDNFFDSYDVFNDPLAGVNPNELDEEEMKIYKEEIKEREKNSENQWMVFLNSICDNRFELFDKALGSNLFMMFNQFSYLKSK